MTQTLEEKSTISLATLVQDYAIYNQWANETLVNWLKTKPAEVMSQEVASSFPSIRETLIHIWDTERFWFSVLKQIPAPLSFRMHGFDGTLEDVFNGITEQSKELTDYIKTLDDFELAEAVSFDTPWVKGTQARFEFAHHCLNHSTYHRGQLVTIGRNVGFTDAPMTDYSFYLLRVKGK